MPLYLKYIDRFDNMLRDIEDMRHDPLMGSPAGLDLVLKDAKAALQIARLYCRHRLAVGVQTPSLKDERCIA